MTVVAPGHAAALRATLAVLAVAVAVAAPVAACAGGDVPVAPLPVQPPATASPSPGPASTSPTSARPPTPRAPGPSSAVPPAPRTPPAPTPTPDPGGTPTATRSPSGPPGTCYGAVRYDLVVADTELALLRSLCFAAGGVLRVIGVGPGEVTVDRADLVSRSYEAGVVDIRFVRPGTVAVLIPRDGTTYTVTVVIR